MNKTQGVGNRQRSATEAKRGAKTIRVVAAHAGIQRQKGVKGQTKKRLTKVAQFKKSRKSTPTPSTAWMPYLYEGK